MLKKGLSIFVLLLCLPCLLFSDISLTEREYQEVMTALNNSEQELIQQEKTINELRNLQQISEKITSGQEQNYEQLKTFLEQQEKEQGRDKVRAFIYGAVLAVTGLFFFEKT